MESRCFVRNCHGLHDPIPCGQDATYMWATSTLCSVCRCRGYTCLDGCILRKALESRRQLQQNNYRKHQNQYSSGDMGWDDDVMDDDDDLVAVTVPPVVLQIV